MCSGWTPSSTGRARSLSLRCAPMALQGTRRYTRRASTPLSDRFNLRIGQDPPARSDRGEGFKFPHVFTTYHWNMAMYEPQADHFDSSKTLPFVGGLRLVPLALWGFHLALMKALVSGPGCFLRAH